MRGVNLAGSAAPVRDPKPTDVAVRRRSDGVFLYTWSGVLLESDRPKFLSSLSKARLSVRVDMGLDLIDVEFVTRQELMEINK